MRIESLLKTDLRLIKKKRIVVEADTKNDD